MERIGVVRDVTILFLSAAFSLIARPADAVCDPDPTVENRAREVANVVVATVGDLADTTVDEHGFLFLDYTPSARVHFQVVVRKVLKGTAIPDTLILPLWGGVYSTVEWVMQEQGFPCHTFINRGQLVVLFVEDVVDLSRQDPHVIFLLDRPEWDPSLLQTDDVLVRVQESVASPSGVGERESWGTVKRRLR